VRRAFVTARSKPLFALVVAIACGSVWWLWRADVLPPPATTSTDAAPAAAPSLRSAVEDEAERVLAATGFEVHELPVVEPSDEPAEESPGPAPTELWGQVVDADSEAAVAGAEVELQHCAADDFGHFDAGSAQRVVSLARQRSDRDGRFVFAVRWARPHRLVVRAPGYPTTTVCDRVGGTRVTIELSAAASVAGVVTSRGTPVVDGEIWVRMPANDVELGHARTDVRGGFLVEDLPPGPVEVIAVGAPGETARTRIELEAGETHQLRLDLPGADVVRGRVLDDESSAPIAGAEVATSWSFHGAARTDARGEFELAAGPEQAGLFVYVRAPTHAPTHALLVRGRVRDVRNQDIRLARAIDATGRFVDERGLPLPQVLAAACSSFSIGGPAALTQAADWIRPAVAADGTFVLPGLDPRRPYWLLACSEGYGSRVVGVAASAGGAGPVDLGDIVLRTAASIEGRVLVENEPQADVVVQIESLSIGDAPLPAHLPMHFRPSQIERGTTRTDDRGRFRFADLGAGNYVLTTWTAAGSVTLQARVRLQPGERRDDIALARRAITGRLVGPGATPVVARVWLEAPNGSQLVNVQSDADGRFRFEVSDDFRGRLRAAVPGLATLQGRIEEVVAGQDLVVPMARP
jgi:protocatechuate 3,4-dioxygenase beta subunit